MPNLDDTIEQLRQHRAEAIERGLQAAADIGRFNAALEALGVDVALDAGTAARLAAAADLRPAAAKQEPDPPRPRAAPAKAPAARPPKRPPKRPPIEEVARVANEARAAGEPMAATICERFDVPPTTVNNWLTKARQLGLLTISPGGPRLPEPKSPPAERSTLEGVAHLEKLIAGELDDVG